MLGLSDQASPYQADTQLLHRVPRLERSKSGRLNRFIEAASISTRKGAELSAGSGDRMFRVLGQVVGNCEPWRLGADEDVHGRADGRIVDERSHANVDEGPGADDRIEKGAAHFAADIVAIFVAEDQQLV